MTSTATAPAGASPATPGGGAWRQEVTDLARAATGGLLFGIPLLYTMEVWWTGIQATPVQSLVALALSFVAAVVLNHTSGFRSTRDVRLADAVADAVEVVGLSIVLAAVLLFVLHEITVDTPRGVVLGKLAFEAVPLSIGAALAGQFLHESRDGGSGGGDGDDDDASPDTSPRPTLADIGATMIGAVFVAMNIAPTDEIPMLDTAMGPPRVLALLAASLVVSYAIVFAAGFSGESQRRAQTGLLQDPLTETIVCYLVSLVVAGGLLWAFDRTEGPWTSSLTHIVVLGLPAAVGGAAGRIAI